MKNVAAFCICLKSLPEAKVKRFILIALTKEVSKKPSIDFVLWFTLMKSILMKCSKLRKEKKIQNVQFETKNNFQEIELNPQGDKKFKEKADPGWIKGLVTSGQDSTQLSFQLVKRNS